MTNNGNVREECGVRGTSYDENVAWLRSLPDGKFSYPKLADILEINQRYLWEYMERGIVPTNKKARDAMGIVVVSKGAKIYQALNRRAQAQGWPSWSRYRLAVRDSEVLIEPFGERDE